MVALLVALFVGVAAFGLFTTSVALLYAGVPAAVLVATAAVTSMLGFVAARAAAQSRRSRAEQS
ncbi:MAG: hypothetical protein ACXVW2_10170 [Nocardioidaceae bacterium]